MGFGRACAPVRCAHPSFWVHRHAKRGAVGPPAHRSFADPSDDILWSKLYTGATICSNFFRFLLFKNCFLSLSFCYTLLFLLLLSLLILLVLFFLFLFFSSSAIVTHTHTHTHTKYPRQILYMIDSAEEIYHNQHFGSMPPHSRQLA